MAPILPYIPTETKDASTNAAAALAARARDFAATAAASEPSHVRIRVVMEGPGGFWMRCLVVLLYATLMSIIGHFVLFFLYSSWQMLCSVFESFRSSSIRLDEDESEEPLLAYGESGEVHSCWLGTDMLPVTSYVERTVTVVEEKSEY